MNSVNGLISLAREEKNPAEFANYLNMMEKSLRKLEVFTNDMISSLKNRGSAILSPLRPADLVSEIVDELKYSSEASGITFTIDIDPAIVLQTDASRMRIIFSNLVSNAIRYHDADKDNRFVRIRAAQSPLLVVFEVEDNGIGIAEEHQKQIFETYYTIGNVEGSSGLGLSNVRDAVNKLNGSIDVESTPSIGSTFRISFSLN
jgi:signal transduction histidine kinase